MLLEMKQVFIFLTIKKEQIQRGKINCLFQEMVSMT